MVSSRKHSTPGMLHEKMAASRICNGCGTASDVLFMIVCAYLRRNPVEASALMPSLGLTGDPLH